MRPTLRGGIKKQDRGRQTESQKYRNKQINKLEAIALLHNVSDRHSEESFEFWKKSYCTKGVLFYYHNKMPEPLLLLQHSCDPGYLEWNTAIWKS